MWIGVYAEELTLRKAEMETLALLGHDSRALNREG